jgi:membrane protease YdiL (CAAX protease family)
MAAPRIIHRLFDVGWCVLVPLGVAAAYLGLGGGLVPAAGEPILGTVLLDGVAIVLVGVVRLTRLRWLAYAPGPRPRWAIPRFGRTVVSGVVLAFLAGQALALWLYATHGSAGFDESIRVRHGAGTMLTLLLVLVVAPVAEEMLFRGLIYPLLRRRVSVVPSVILTTGIFGLMHGNAVQFASALPLAVLLGLVYERTRVLWPCTLLHLGFNLLATLVPAPMLAGLANPLSALLLTMAFVGYALILYRMVFDPSHRSARTAGETETTKRTR